MFHRPFARILAVFLALAPLLGACAGGRVQSFGQTAALRTPSGVVDYSDIRPTGPNVRPRPLLLLTGYAVTKEMWNAAFVRALAEHRRVLLMDNPGMGPSPAPNGIPEIADMARNAAALLDGLGIRRADVLGWSMGGMTAQELALARPDLVAKVVLYATAPDNAELMPVLKRMAGMSNEELLDSMFPPAWSARHPSAAERLPRRPRPADLTVIGQQYSAMRDWQGDVNRLKKLHMPVLILSGDADWVCPPEESRRMAARIPRATLETVPQGGHWMMHQFPDKLARLVVDFLDAPRSAADSPAK